MHLPLIAWDTLRDAPTEHLAHLLARYLLRGSGNSLVANNVFSGAKLAASEESAPDDADDLLDRLSDAWAWLVAHGYLGPESRQTDAAYVRITQAGRQFAEDDRAVARVWAEDRLSQELDPALGTARVNIMMGEYETAAFAAMKAVEMAVRDASQLADSLVGVKLMIAAFNANEFGPLCDPSAESGERQAAMSLFAGAIGTFKNPASHRSVAFTDPIEVVEIVQLADLLLRIVRRRVAASID